jgi:hypothetical protein
MTDKDIKQAEDVAISAIGEKEQGDIRTTTSGYRVRYRPVGVGLMQKVSSGIPDPIIPTIPHPNFPDDESKMIENPMDPKYREKLRKVQAQREEAMLNALFLRSIELIDGLPEDREWLEDLVFLGVLTQKEIDEATPKHFELWFKKHVVADMETQNHIMKSMGLTERMVAEARDTFQGNT